MTADKMTIEEARRKCRCPYRQDLELLCFEDNCAKTDCEIYIRASGQLAHSINESLANLNEK